MQNSKKETPKGLKIDLAGIFGIEKIGKVFWQPPLGLIAHHGGTTELDLLGLPSVEELIEFNKRQVTAHFYLEIDLTEVTQGFEINGEFKVFQNGKLYPAAQEEMKIIEVESQTVTNGHDIELTQDHYTQDPKDADKGYLKLDCSFQIPNDNKTYHIVFDLSGHHINSSDPDHPTSIEIDENHNIIIISSTLILPENQGNVTDEDLEYYDFVKLYLPDHIIKQSIPN